MLLDLVRLISLLVIGLTLEFAEMLLTALLTGRLVTMEIMVLLRFTASFPDTRPASSPAIIILLPETYVS